MGRLNIIDFGTRLIETRDLDPVYCAIRGANLSQDQLARLLLAYWCFYHLGFAGWASENKGDDYWQVMMIAAQNTVPPFDSLPGMRWPRGAERRHFRGEKCVAAVRWFSQYPPEHWVLDFASAPPEKMTDRSLMREIQEWPMFGPWIAFKAADMIERVMGRHVQFDRNIGLMYREPAEGLKMLVEWDPHYGTISDAYKFLLNYFAPMGAPPAKDRPCGPQEVETILCKWKSHMGGHYPIGKDIRELRHALSGWGETAERMLAACPQEVTV